MNTTTVTLTDDVLYLSSTGDDLTELVIGLNVKPSTREYRRINAFEFAGASFYGQGLSNQWNLDYIVSTLGLSIEALHEFFERDKLLVRAAIQAQNYPKTASRIFTGTKRPYVPLVEADWAYSSIGLGIPVEHHKDGSIHTCIFGVIIFLNQVNTGEVTLIPADGKNTLLQIGNLRGCLTGKRNIDLIY